METLLTFAEKVNKILDRECEIFNLEKTGPFCAKHHWLPEMFFLPFFEMGMTPEETAIEMNEPI